MVRKKGTARKNCRRSFGIIDFVRIFIIHISCSFFIEIILEDNNLVVNNK